jgi:peptide/nickel transport system permease protein
VSALIRRLWHGLIVIAIVATVVFVLVRLAPGDPFATALENSRLTPALREQWRAAYGLDGGIGTQYARWITALLHGDLGFSTSTGQPVSHAIARALPNTLALMTVALIIAFTAGIAIGSWQAIRRDGIADHVLGAATLVGGALPDFWLSLIVLLAGAYWWRLFPVGGASDPLLPLAAGTAAILRDRAWHVALPALTLVILIAAPVARQQRGALLDRFASDWVRTATAKGVRPRTVFRRHVLRTALGPVVTLAGLAFPALVGGAVFVETVFAWPGMGRLAASAIAARDYHLVVGCVVVGSTMVVIGSTIADIVMQRLDPRATLDGDAAPTRS